jgi:hypothetical protein
LDARESELQVRMAVSTILLEALGRANAACIPAP